MPLLAQSLPCKLLVCKYAYPVHMSIGGGSLISSIYTNVCLLCYTIQGMLIGLYSLFFFLYPAYVLCSSFFFLHSLYYLHRGARNLESCTLAYSRLYHPFFLSSISPLFCTRCAFHLYIVILYLGKKVSWICICFTLFVFSKRTCQRARILMISPALGICLFAYIVYQVSSPKARHA